MANRAHVPQFGKWDTQEVPYTVYFDKARKGRGATPGGKMINPNDPSENPEMFAPPPQPAASPPPQPRTRPQTPVKPQPEPRQSRREEGNFRPYESPARNENLSRRSEQAYQNSPINRGGRTARQNAGSTDNNSFDRSPLHPQQPAKSSGRGGASPAYNDGSGSGGGGGSSGGGSGGGGGGGRSRMRPIPGDESPEGSAAVPRFGDWDENNPQSADNYTHIFNKVRDERHNPGSNEGGVNRTPRRHTQNVSSARQGCCFPWLGK